MIIKKILKEIYIINWKFFSKIYSPFIIKKYFLNNKISKLHIGSGKNYKLGWLNCDISPFSTNVIYTDVTKKFPFKDNSLDYIYSEHMIEHISYKDGLLMLKECYRILKPNGIIRITTPDLFILIDILKNDQNKYNDYINWSHDENNLVDKNSIEVFNNFFQSWGHKFIYSKDFMKSNLDKIGFKNLEFFHVGESTHENLKNLENINRLPKNFLQIESFTVEGNK